MYMEPQWIVYHVMHEETNGSIAWLILFIIFDIIVLWKKKEQLSKKKKKKKKKNLKST